MLHVNDLQLWDTCNPYYACAELTTQYQGVMWFIQGQEVTPSVGYNHLGEGKLYGLTGEDSQVQIILTNILSSQGFSEWE